MPGAGEFGTHIVGGGTRYLQAGSSLALECVVTHTREPPSAVFWYRDNSVLDYDSPRGGISLQVGRDRRGSWILEAVWLLLLWLLILSR